jgi:hypothetical protein
MSLVQIPPHIRLMTAIHDAIAAVDFQDRAGLSASLKVQFSRNRNATRQEKPSLLIVFVGDDPRTGDEQDHNAWETVRELVVDLQVDLDLNSENSGIDPTGLLFLSNTIAAAVSSLRDPIEPIYLGGLCDYIMAGSIDPEERSQPDIGRMTRALTVLYRVRSDDPNILLAAGV